MVLADYIERKAQSLGLEMLFLLTTRTADWYAFDSYQILISCMLFMSVYDYLKLDLIITDGFVFKSNIYFLFLKVPTSFYFRFMAAFIYAIVATSTLN